VPERLTKAAFAGALGSRFWLHHAPEVKLPVELIEIREGRPLPDYEQFSVLFRGPRESVLPQRIYHIEHDEMGAFDLFLVPVGRDHQGTTYEAVFSRAVGKQD